MEIKSSNKKTGHYGEDIACNYLEKSGWKILERNYRYSRYAEIDIIAKDNSKNEIVFIEVKTRTNKKYGNPSDSVNKNKQKHIYKSAYKFSVHHLYFQNFYKTNILKIYLLNIHI